MRPATLPILLCCILVLAACDRRDAADPAAMTMRVHTVPPERAEAMMQSLNGALRLNKESAVGTVSLGAPGELIVLAPENLQPSIEQSVQKLNAANPETATDGAQQLRLRFWSVDAIPGEGEDSPSLSAIASALDALREVRGAAHFVLRDEIEAVSTDDRSTRRDWVVTPKEAGAAGLQQELNYTFRSESGKRFLDFSFRDSNYPQPPIVPGARIWNVRTNVSTATSVTLGQTLVLATQPLATSPDNTATTRYYIVRVDAVGAD